MNNNFNSLLEDFEKIKSNNINLANNDKTRTLFGKKELDKKIEPKIKLNIKNNLNFVPENQISGLYHQLDIQDNSVLLSEHISNYDDDDYQNKYFVQNNNLKELTEKSFGIPPLKSDNNISAITKRDDYYRSGPTGNLYERNKERDFFLDNDSKYNFFNNAKNNVIQDNNIEYKEEHSNKQFYLKKKQFLKKELLYPNVNLKNIIKEQLVEHTLIIDSMDRDWVIYQNIFNFTVKFNGIKETKAPYFMKDLKKVRYLRLDKLILPDLYYLETDADVTKLFLSAVPQNANNPINIGDRFGASNEYIVVEVDALLKYSFKDINTGLYYYVTWTGVVNNYYYFNILKKISDDRFTELEISEITSPNEYSTNSDTMKSFGILYPERVHNGGVYVNTTYSNVVYKFSNLKNITSLSFKFKNSIGELLDSTTNEDTSVTTVKKDIGDINSPSTYIRHPLFKHKQIHMVFKVGVIELEQNINNII